MKSIFAYIAIFSLITLSLTSCFEKSQPEEWESNQEEFNIDEETAQLLDELIEITQEEEPETSPQEEEIWGPLIDSEYTSWDIILNDFWPMMSISSPYTLTGKAPRKWFFEWSFPVALLTLESEIIAEAPASWAWLEPVWDSDELSGDDMIDFTIKLEFDIPEDSTWDAKLRFTFVDMSWETNGEYLEEMVILTD